MGSFTGKVQSQGNDSLRLCPRYAVDFGSGEYKITEGFYDVPLGGVVDVTTEKALKDFAEVRTKQLQGERKNLEKLSKEGN